MKRRKPGTFQIGNKSACGPHSPGSGRPPDWLKNACREIVDKRELIRFLGAVASGEKVDVFVSRESDTVCRIPAGIKDRLKAIEMLLDRGWGKPAQPLEHEGTVVGRMVLIFPSETEKK